MKAKGIRSSVVTIALFALAATLLIFSVAGSSQAALTYFSETYGAEVSMYDIGVTLVENGEGVSNRDYTGSGDIWNQHTGELVLKLPEATQGELQLEHTYKEELSVTNSGTIDEYVRVTLYRWWEDANGNKLTGLSPSLIDLNILTGGNGWIEDVNSRSAERNVLYYQSILPAGKPSPKFSDTLTIHEIDPDDPEALGMRANVTVDERVDENGRTIITTTYDYDGVKFVLRADVDAVQTHNAEDAIRSAWGVEMSQFGIQ